MRVQKDGKEVKYTVENDLLCFDGYKVAVHTYNLEGTLLVKSELLVLKEAIIFASEHKAKIELVLGNVHFEIAVGFVSFKEETYSTSHILKLIHIFKQCQPYKSDELQTENKRIANKYRKECRELRAKIEAALHLPPNLNTNRYEALLLAVERALEIKDE